MYFGRLWTADKMPCDMRPNICKMHLPLNWSSTSSCQATRRAVRTAPYGYPLCHCFWYLSTAFLHSPEHSCSCAAQEQTCGHLPTHEPAGLLATSLPPLPGLGTWWHMELSEHFVIRPLGSFPLAVKKKDRSTCSSSPVLSEQLQKCLEVCPGLCEPCMRGSVRFYSSCCSSHMAPSPPRGSRAGFSLVFNMQAFTVLHFALPPPPCAGCIVAEQGGSCCSPTALTGRLPAHPYPHSGRQWGTHTALLGTTAAWGVKHTAGCVKQSQNTWIQGKN